MENIPLSDFDGVVRAVKGVPFEPTRQHGELAPTGSLYSWMRENAPVWRREEYGGYWVISRYSDVCEVLRDTDTFSSAYGINVPPVHGPAHASALIGTDPPDHTRLRRALAGYASPRGVQSFAPLIEELAGQYLGALAKSERADLVKEFIAPFHGRVLARFIGVPDKDWHLFREYKERLVDARLAEWNSREPGCPVKMIGPDEASTLADSMLRGHIAQMVEDHGKTDIANQHDLISVLIQQRTAGAVAEDEFAGIVYTMFVAGNDTVVHGLSRAAFLLHRDLVVNKAVMSASSWTELGPLVDEILRLQSPVEGLARVAQRDASIGGVNIAAGDRVLVLYASANRDPNKFNDPESLDPMRAPNPHLAYGFGRHRCLGAPLAHLELQIAIWHLAHRFPPYAVEDDGVSIDPGSSGWGVATLPIRLHATAHPE